MTISLAEIRALDATRWPTPTKLVYDQPPAAPATVTVSGGRNILRVQWTTVTGVDGYDVAVMTSPNLAAPDVNIVTLSGDKTREYVYQTGNNALLRYFAVRSSLGGIVSAWSAVVSATSTLSKDNNLSSASTDATRTATGEGIIRTITVAANTLGTNDGLRIWACGVQTVSAFTGAIRIRWGGLTGTIVASHESGAGSEWLMQAEIFNRNATNSQILSGISFIPTGLSNLNRTTAAQDTTSSVDLVITGQIGTAGDSITVSLIETSIIRGTASATDGLPPTPPGNPPSGSGGEVAGRGTK